MLFFAVTKQQCVSSFEDGQRLMQEGRLVAAREQLLVCAQSGCPAAVSERCAEWIASVDRDLPTLIVVARDESGHDIADGTLFVDGKVAAERLDGRAVPLDPGEHVVRVEHADSLPAEDRVVARAGEKNRLLPLVLHARAATAPVAAADTGAGAPPGTATPDRRRTLVLPIALASAGVVALASSIFFATSAADDEDELRARCAPACSEHDAAVIDRKNAIAGVSLAIGIVSLGAAAWFFVDGQKTRAVTQLTSFAPLRF